MRAPHYQESTPARRMSGKIVDNPALGEGTRSLKVATQLLDKEPKTWDITKQSFVHTARGLGRDPSAADRKTQLKPNSA